jgi:hypothetical protein
VRMEHRAPAVSGTGLRPVCKSTEKVSVGVADDGGWAEDGLEMGTASSGSL